MCTKCNNYMMLDFQMFCICKIVNMKELFYLSDTLFCQTYLFFFFIDNVITGFYNIFPHDCIYFRKFATSFSSNQLSCKYITCFIQFGRFTTLSGNDKRCSCLINKNRVDLIDNGILKASLYQLLFVNYHVISQVIKSQFIIGNIGNITIILFTAFIIFHII